MADKIEEWKLLEKIERVEHTTAENFADVREEMTGIREVLNNGIVKATLDNTKAIELLTERFNQLDKKISNSDANQEGKISMMKLVIATISGVGGGAVTVLSILRYLGAI